MPKYWFDHVHLTNHDPDKTAEFYEKAIGAKKGKINLPDGRSITSVSLGDVDILVTPPRPKPIVPSTLPDGCGLDHFGIRTDNIEAAVADLTAKGAKFVMDITAISPTLKISFFTTPEGILIELTERSE